MALSRYYFQSVKTIVDSNKKTREILSAFPSLDPKSLQSDSDIFIKLTYGQRIDNIAYDYLGNGEYWWIICLLNGLSTPFDRNIIVGQTLRIPTNITRFIQLLEAQST